MAAAAASEMISLRMVSASVSGVRASHHVWRCVSFSSDRPAASPLRVRGAARPEALAHLRHPRSRAIQQALIGTGVPLARLSGVVDVLHAADAGVPAGTPHAIAARVPAE